MKPTRFDSTRITSEFSKDSLCTLTITEVPSTLNT